MNIIIDRTWKQGSLVNIEDLRGLTFQAEAQAHTFRISGVDAAGNPITLTGTPSGVMLRPDNTDVALTCAVSDGKVTATLPAECYDVPGRVGITIYLTSNSQKVCIYSAITSVNRTSSGTASPGTTSSVVDLVNAIEAAIAQIPASDTNLKGALAPTYSDSAVYAVGQYAWYDGKLYKCTTAITTSESWTSGHWTEAKLAQDVCDLKSAINNDIYSHIEWLAKKTGTDRVFSIRTVGSSISKDATLTKLKANAGSKIKFNVSGSGFASQDVYVYFKYVGSDSYTNMQTIRVGQDTTKTAEYELEEFYLYHGSANAGETITITAVVTDSLSGDIISNIVTLNTEVDNGNAFDNTILNQLNYQTGCEISIKTVIAKSTISADDTAIAMTFVKGDAFDAYVDGDGVSGLTGITVYFKYSGLSTRTNIGSINAGTRKRFYVPNNVIEVSFYKTGNASANIGKSIGVVISRVNQIKQIVPYFQQSPKNFIASDFIRGVTNATSGVIPSNTSDGGVIMPFSVTGGLTYTMWWENDMRTQNMVYLYILELDSSKEPIKRSDGITRTTLSKTITLDEDTRYVSISVFSSGVNWEDTLPSRIQFELGSNKTEFENHEVIKPEFFNAKQIYDKLYNAGYMSTDGAAALPDYYNAYMVTKAARINDLAKVCAGQGDVFIFITDEHWTMNQQQSPKLISYLNASCCIARVFSGGDTGNDVDPDFCKKIRSSFNHEIHHVMGNHEWFEPNGNIAFYYMDSYEKEQIGNTVEHYYYVDNPQKKIRYIILNTYLSNNGSPINGYTQDQLSWLTNVALDIETGWSVIVFTHDFDPSESNVSPFASALDTAKSNGKDVIAVFIGHRHYDAVWHTTGGIPIIVTTCDKNEPWINSGTDMEPWLTSQRIAGTTSEQAFDTVVIDRENKTIKCVRIGGLAMDNVDKKQGQTGFTTDGTLEERTITYT